MKRILNIALLLIAIVCCAPTAQAQGRKVLYLHNYNNAPYHFGFLLGLNFMDYTLQLREGFMNDTLDGAQFPITTEGFNDADLNSFIIQNVESRKMTRNPGFSVGVIGDLRLGNYFNLRFSPTLSLSWRQVYYDVVLFDSNGEVLQNSQGQYTGYRQVTSVDNLASYLEFPLHLKYRSKRYNNIGAYLITGVNPKLYLISAQKSQDENTGNPKYLIPKRGDVAFEIGAGYDIYNQWFKMGVELKMSFGMFDILTQQQSFRNFLWGNPLESLKSKQLQLSFTFE